MGALLDAARNGEKCWLSRAKIEKSLLRESNRKILYRDIDLAVAAYLILCLRRGTVVEYTGSEVP